MAQAIPFPKINAKAAQRLSRVFNSAANLRLNQDRDINEFLKGLIAFANRCPMCHGVGTVNFEQANGWDEPCPRCASPPQQMSTKGRES